MSLICLSSRGLSDSASNYTNFFGGRGIEFPRESEVCLVGASIKKQSPNDLAYNIKNDAGTFAIHYGGRGSGVRDSMRDDVIVQEEITSDIRGITTALTSSMKKQMTMSPLRHFPNVTLDLAGGGPGVPATGWEIKLPMAECRNTLPGDWAVPKNLPFIANVRIGNTATGTGLTPEAGKTCWVEDSRRLFNTDNQGIHGTYGTQLEGAKFTFTWTTGDDASLYDGMQGGIITCDRLLDAYEPHSWVTNPNQEDSDNPSPGTYEQKIDLGYEIVNNRGRLNIQTFKNKFEGDGYSREILNVLQVPPSGADQTITILFRPVTDGGNNAWDVATEIALAGYTQRALVALTDDEGDFPIGKYNGNAEGVGVGLSCCQFWGKNNDAEVVVEAAYDDDPAIALVAGGVTAYPHAILSVFSSISDAYAVESGLSDNFRLLAQTRCNSADTFGMAAGIIQISTNSVTDPIISEILPAEWGIQDSPLCIQLPNLPITGFLGGGASAVGGATALPILGIVDSYENVSTTESGICIYEPKNENWIKLMNRDSFTLNELQVRITDLFGVLPTYLDTPTHVWIKIKAGTTEKV